jgi:hypothetical protein
LAAEHEPFAVLSPPLQSRLIILGEALQSLPHLLVGKVLREPTATRDLFSKVDLFIFHGSPSSILRDSSHARARNDAARMTVPSGAFT